MAENSGIIPAYAGLTAAHDQPSGSGQDHPRLRGVNIDEGVDLLLDGGIIPAYAGLTYGDYYLRKLSEDHPRLRGVNLATRLVRRHVVGSSPLTRG